MMTNEIYQWISVLISIGCLQSSAENLFLACRIPSINQFSMRDTTLIKPFFKWMSFGYDSPGIWIIYVGKLTIAIILLIGSFWGGVYWWLPLLYLLVEFLGYQRQYFLANSDAPLQRVVLISLALHYYADDEFISTVVLYFISLQLCMAYMAAGWHKFKSTAWQDASVFPLVFTAHLPTKLQPFFNGGWNLKWLSRLIVVWEISFFFSLLGGFISQVYLIVGVLFHGFISVGAGINFFLFTFIACYPAVYFVGNHFFNLF